mgnify:FL=1
MIEDLRAEIDRIDEELVELLNRRATQAVEIGQYKRVKGIDVTDEDREEIVLERVIERNDGPFSDGQIYRIYRQIISETKELQKEVDSDDSGNEARSN